MFLWIANLTVMLFRDRRTFGIRKGAGGKVLTAHLVWIVEHLMLTGKLGGILAAWGLVVATSVTSQSAPFGDSYDFVAARSGTFDHVWSNANNPCPSVQQSNGCRDFSNSPMQGFCD